MHPAKPQVVLWAWERREDLRFLASKPVAVAFLSQTLVLSDGQVRVLPRRQPLYVDSHTYLIAVTRIESSREQPPSFDRPQLERLRDVIAATQRLDGVRELQIDFDSTASARAAYRRLLHELRAVVDMPLSVTALASWCLFDRWIDAPPLPVDEVVPMVFSMGPDGPKVLAEVQRAGSFRSANCQSSVGWKLGEPTVKLRGGRTVYWFSPLPWTEQTFAQAQRSWP